jgi:hypothetical protein
MPVWIDITRATPIRRFRLEIGDEMISVNFGRDMPPQMVRDRVLQALDVMLPAKSTDLLADGYILTA